MPKKRLEVVPHTGISDDYFNEWGWRTFTLRPRPAQIEQERLERLVETFKTHPVKNYEKRFPAEEWAEVLTKQNRDRVPQLNMLADSANKNFTEIYAGLEDNFRFVLTLVKELIYGKRKAKSTK